MKKAEQYLSQNWIGELRWIGWIPEKKWNTIKDYKSRVGAITITITYHIGDRLVASDRNLSPRDKLLVKRPNVKVLERLRHEMVTGMIKYVRPAPPKVSSGGKLLGVGKPMPQYQTLSKLGFQLKDGEIGDGLYDRKEGDKWEQEEVIAIVKGELGTVEMADTDA